ncbi:MAG: hypothetical protein K2M55_03500 [Muribaculaceae bacterium]|nr:hypothetical protein [Muribaculaceae bacterium]
MYFTIFSGIIDSKIKSLTGHFFGYWHNICSTINIPEFVSDVLIHTLNVPVSI